MVSPVAATPAQQLVGAVLLRRYRLERLLGEGGMGAVYAAKSSTDDQVYAIKILHAEFVHDPQVRARFLEEGRTCQRLVHPNILRVHEVGEAEDGTPFLVMELLEGVPLSAYTKGGGRVPPPQAVRVLQGMLAALAAAHATGIVHRDLKPDNIFLAREGGGRFVVKLLDFGIAKVMDAAGGMGNKTRTGMLLGTPAYMSPEQITSSKDVDARSDLFSAGVLFYEMLTGKVAFPAPNDFARLTVVLSQEPEPIDRVDPQLAPFAPFLARALQKDRANRFQSATEMARALAALEGEQPASRLLARPLDELPQIPGAAPAHLGNGLRAAIASTEPGAPAPPREASISAPPPAFASAPPPGFASMPPTRAAGGTLASGSSPPVRLPPPQVELAPEPSLRASRAAGIAPLLVVALVLGALLAGFLLGYAVARSS